MSDSGIDATINTSGCSSGAGLTTPNLNVDSQSSGGGIVSAAASIHNGSGDETLFTKPPARDGMTAQVIVCYCSRTLNSTKTSHIIFRNIMKQRKFFALDRPR